MCVFAIYTTADLKDNNQEVESQLQFLTILQENHKMLTEHHTSLRDLVKKGEEAISHSDQSLLMLSKADINMKTGLIPSMDHSLDSLRLNLRFGETTFNGVADPVKIRKTFESAAKFEFELRELFKADSDKIMKVKQDLNLHHLNLSNTIKDGQLIAQSTQDHLRRCVRVLVLRGKYHAKGELNPQKEALIWK